MTILMRRARRGLTQMLDCVILTQKVPRDRASVKSSTATDSPPPGHYHIDTQMLYFAMLWEFTTVSLLFTPLTPTVSWAISSARTAACLVGTAPLRDTTPAMVLTWMLSLLTSLS